MEQRAKSIDPRESLSFLKPVPAPPPDFLISYLGLNPNLLPACEL